MASFGGRAGNIFAEMIAPTSLWYCDRPECDGEPHKGWSQKHARKPSQCPPDGNWLVWLFSGGRGTGKTRAGAEWVNDLVWNHGVKRIALVGRTPADIRDVMINGDSGIMECSVKRGHEYMPVHEPTNRRVVWPNGAIAETFSGSAPDQLRGPQHEAAWCDELAAWPDARRGDALGTAWSNLMMGMRIGEAPRCLVTTTPKRVKLIRQLLDRKSTAITHDTTYSNLSNLAPSFRETVVEGYEGTTIGRQELLGEYLQDIDGALWGRETIEDLRLPLMQEPDDGGVDLNELTRIVVGVDPAVTSGEDADETGIIVVGLGPHRSETCKTAKCRGHAYILGDYTKPKLTSDEWARQVVKAYDDFNADRVIAEGNQGHELVDKTLLTVRPGLPIERVNAKHGKRTRAEPIAALYEQGRAHHVGPPLQYDQLEDQQTTWTTDSGESPDRLDALVWAVTDLGIAGGRQGDAFLEVWQNEAANRKPEQPNQLRSVPKLGAFDRAGLKPGCKHRWQQSEAGPYCVFCGGLKPDG